MPVYKLEELKFPEFDGLARDKTLLTIVVSPLEEHGPHLPLGVDAFNAQYFESEITRYFLKNHSDWSVVRIPPLHVGSFAFDAPGSIIIRPRIIRALLVETLSSLAKYGFRYFLISNAHGGPTHIAALEEAAGIVSRRYHARVLSFSGHIVWRFLRGEYWPEIVKRMNLTEEEAAALKDDSHAGQWETSMMLKLRPDLVDPAYISLKPFTVKLIERLQPNYPLKKGEQLGYVGHPGRATLELAEITSEFLIEKAYELVEEGLLSAEGPRSSVFYRVPIFRTNFVPALIALALLTAIVLWLLR